MEIRLFDKEKDYETLCEWWDDWKLPNHHPDALSETGIIISKDGVDICVGFIYSTDSYIAWCEFITMNKKTTKKQREGILEKLFEVMIEKTKAMGFKLIMVFGIEDKKFPVLERLRRKNADTVVENVCQYYKIIN